MITIPRYDESQVKTAPMQIGGRAQGLSAEAFGSGIGAGLQRLGQDGMQAAAEENKRDLETKVFEHRVNLDTLERDIRNGTEADPNNPDDTGTEGILSIKGAESQQYSKIYKDDFLEKARALIPSDLAPQHKLVFNKMVEERYNRVATEIDNHVRAQSEHAHDAAAGAMQASILRNIGTFAEDDNRFQLELGTLMHVVDMTTAQKYGEGTPEAAAISQSARELARNDAYDRRVGTLVSARKITEAQAIVDKAIASGEVTEDKAQYFRNLMKPLQANQAGFSLALEYKTRLEAGEPIDKIIADGQKKLGNDADSFKIFQAQTEVYDKLITEGRVKAVQSAAIPVRQFIIKAGIGKLDPKTLAESPEYLDLLKIGTPQAIKEADTLLNETFKEFNTQQAQERAIRSEGRAEQRLNRTEAKQDQILERQQLLEERQQEFTRLSLNPQQIAEMSDYDLTKKVVELGPRYGEQLRKMKDSLSSPDVLAKVNLESKMFNSIMGGLGITDKNKVAQYYASAQTYIAGLQQDQKRALNPQQMRDAVVAAFQEVDVSYRTKDYIGDGYSYGTEKKRLIDVSNTAAIVIPKSDDDNITKLLQSSGIADNARNRQRIYKQMLADRGAQKIKSKR